MNRPVRNPAQAIGTAELRAFLEKALSRHVASPRHLIELERRPSIYSTSFAMEELDVRLEDGTSLLLFKDLSRRSMLGSVRRVKPTFLYEPLREIETYRSILGRNRLSTAVCYRAIVDPSVERYGLLLEKVPGLGLYQVGDLATWRRVAVWLAIMHARFAEATGRLARAAPLLRYEGDFYRLWADCARASLGRAGLRLSRDARRGMEQTPRRLRPGRRARGGAPGNLPSRRVLRLQRARVRGGGEGLRVCPLPVMSTSIPKGRQGCLEAWPKTRAPSGAIGSRTRGEPQIERRHVWR